MTEFDDLDGYLSPTLKLPVGGRTYEVPNPPAAVGLRLQAAWAIHCAKAADVSPRARDIALVNDTTAETSLEQDALGPVYDQMLDDGVNLETILHAGMTAYMWIVAGERAARLWWVTPKGEAPPRPLRSTSTSTGAASTTKRPASGTGTTSHPTSPANSRKQRRQRTATA